MWSVVQSMCRVCHTGHFQQDQSTLNLDVIILYSYYLQKFDIALGFQVVS